MKRIIKKMRLLVGISFSISYHTFFFSTFNNFSCLKSIFFFSLLPHHHPSHLNHPTYSSSLFLSIYIHRERDIQILFLQATQSLKYHILSYIYFCVSLTYGFSYNVNIRYGGEPVFSIMYLHDERSASKIH